MIVGIVRCMVGLDLCDRGGGGSADYGSHPLAHLPRRTIFDFTLLPCFPVSLFRIFTRKRICRDNKWLERLSQFPCIPVSLYRVEEAAASEVRWLLGNGQ
jgi:hypothetical protein